MTVDSNRQSMAASRVVLMDVAELAGVSRTTASFVLSGRKDMGISAAAEDRVKDAARRLGYRPSLLARSLRMNTSHTIGLLSDGLGGEVFAGELIRGALGAALLHDKMIFVGDTGGDPSVETRLINSMLDRGAGAFIYASERLRQIQLSPLLQEQKVVLVNCTVRPRGTTTVVPDERGAGRAAAAALIHHGHANGILVVGRAGPGASHGLRMRGVNDVLRQHGVPVAATIDTVSQPGRAAAAVGAALRVPGRPTALICLSDQIAMGACQAARECGISVPDDLSVISFGDSQLAPWLEPQLTSVAVPYGEMARQAVEILFAAAKPFGQRLVPMPLIQRLSIAPPSSEGVVRRERSTA